MGQGTSKRRDPLQFLGCGNKTARISTIVGGSRCLVILLFQWLVVLAGFAIRLARGNQINARPVNKSWVLLTLHTILLYMVVTSSIFCCFNNVPPPSDMETWPQKKKEFFVLSKTSKALLISDSVAFGDGHID